EAAGRGAGGALLVHGAAGVGKSSLLQAARGHAAAGGFRGLTTSGVESESRLPFARLYQLPRPTLDALDQLPDSYGRAIRTAFGLIDQTIPNPYPVALSILHLLGECAESAPLLLLVDGAQWLDRPTAEALAFVARRLESERVLLILAMPDGVESPPPAARSPE